MQFIEDNSIGKKSTIPKHRGQGGAISWPES